MSLLFFMVVVLLGLPAPAAAQGCDMGGVGNFTFGTTSPTAATDTVNNIAYSCRSNASPTYFRVCMFIAEGSPIAGVNPRWMTNYNGAQMKYDLYSDAARTKIVGPPPGGGYPVLSATALVTGSWNAQSFSLPIYGRVPGGQDLPAVHGFQAQINGSALYYAWSNAGYPADCMNGAGGSGVTPFYVGATANVPNSCRISLATDLDFGNAESLAANIDQTSRIGVRCPSGSTWRLSLDNGANASGTTRRMRNSSGGFIPYELYRDSARSQRWGSSTGESVTGTSSQGDAASTINTVYGRVPPLASAGSGTYVDTVTITLTY